jgi:pimeloyl-ACP methyl ester carboxylesterase
MARVMPGCRLVEVPNSCHAVHLDNPTGFIAAVRPFLCPTELSAAGRGEGMQ